LTARKLAALAVVTAVAAACASAPPQPKPSAAPTAAATTAPPAENLLDARRIIGTENGVRVEATVYTDTLKEGANVTVNYDITNERDTPVAIAELVPLSSYDAETRTLTMEIGSEVPGEQLLPRLVVIPPGGKKSFTAAAHVGSVRPSDAVFKGVPNAFRVKVNFLDDTKPFTALIGIPERAVNDPKLANDLFPQWLERNEVVITNALPMRWGGSTNNAQPGADWMTPHPLTGRRH
jgi:hypothetical protein